MKKVGRFEISRNWPVPDTQLPRSRSNRCKLAFITLLGVARVFLGATRCYVYAWSRDSFGSWGWAHLKRSLCELRKQMRRGRDRAHGNPIHLPLLRIITPVH